MFGNVSSMIWFISCKYAGDMEGCINSICLRVDAHWSQLSPQHHTTLSGREFTSLEWECAFHTSHAVPITGASTVPRVAPFTPRTSQRGRQWKTLGAYRLRGSTNFQPGNFIFHCGDHLKVAIFSDG
jgi:hypothetical protein